MKYEKYLIKKGKLDLLSSLKALDENIVNKAMKEYDLNSIEELKEYIIEDFEMCLDMSKDDMFTRRYFERLLENENSEWMSAYQEDIEGLMVFVYKNGNHYSYYIPIEIKAIINKLLFEMPEEERFNLEYAANTPIIKDLRALLKTLGVKDLRHIGDLLLINRLSNRPKKELVNIIYNALINEDRLSEIIERFVDKEFNLLKELMNNKGTIQNNTISMEEYHFLYMLGLVFLFKRDGKFYISMTDDVYNVIKKIYLCKFDMIVEENTKAYNLVQAMVELYGVVSHGELDYYYSLYYGNGKDLGIPDNALYFCERCDDISRIHTEHNIYFVNKILDNDNLKSILDDIINRQTVVERKEFKLSELLKYLDYKYYEDNDSKKKFKKYLKKNNISDEVIEQIILNIAKLYRLGGSFIAVTLELLQDYGVDVTENNMNEILGYLNEIYNNTRIWTNNGWTPIEMRKNYEKLNK